MDHLPRIFTLFVFLTIITSQFPSTCHSRHVNDNSSSSNSSTVTNNDTDYKNRAMNATAALWARSNATAAFVGNQSLYSSVNTSTLYLQTQQTRKLPTFAELAASARYIIVDQHGQGQFRTVQAAINSIPEYNTQWFYIQINAGVYNEKVTIPYNKPFITFQGAGRLSTIISWNDRASTFGTANSATFTVNSPYFIAKGMGFRNSAPPPPPGAYGGQAVAVLLNGDKMAFYECGFYGAQDTLFDYEGKHYFKDCYIQGSIDFIFGHGQSIYRGCQLVVTAVSGYLSGSITAQNRNNPRDPSGFVFVGCTIVGTGEVYLGRAWGAYSRVIFMSTYMSGIVVPDGWYDWGQPSRRRTVYYGQYKCTGPGSDTTRRVPWSHDLSAFEAQPYLRLSFIDAGSWLQEI